VTAISLISERWAVVYSDNQTDNRRNHGIALPYRKCLRNMKSGQSSLFSPLDPSIDPAKEKEEEDRSPSFPDHLPGQPAHPRLS
jgi:hypothetical protein